MRYKVDPGLYALADPDAKSPVLVSANYKMSFDFLRQSLEGRSAWILVLDTDGINVWCAAGKGSFGTEELAERVNTSGLAEVVDHRVLIVPQLGAPGIAAHQVKKLCGFKVVYGPVRAADLPTFLDSGLKAKPEMRLKTFSLSERLALVPVELVHALKKFLMLLPVLFVLNGLSETGGFFKNAFSGGSHDALGLLAGIVTGCIMTPALLPWLPGRAFSAKGAWMGLAGAFFFLVMRSGMHGIAPSGALETAAWLLIIPAVSSYLAMNFTGCSTFTSLSGVKKEMRWAVPAQIAAAAAGLLLWIVSRFFI